MKYTIVTAKKMCIIDVLPIYALLFEQTEVILKKYCILAQFEVHYLLAH